MRYLLPLVVGAALTVGLASPAQAASNEWTADVSGHAVSWGGSPRMGLIELGSHRLAQPANAVTAAVTGDGVVDVRGLRPDGQWTEWLEAPATLPVTTSTIQTRVVLSGGKASRVKLAASRTPAAADVSVAAAGRAYRVYATREGLVGGGTANGHTIRSRDHFVALPSRRGLAPNNSGSYSVQVCASNGRCEWAPVWDVGPWNTKDDYWNPSTTREMWKNLPQGKPEAQAAYEDNYNGGKDQSGREVANPAGIDLADGTFLDGLKLTTNSWVTVTYLWTGSGPAHLCCQRHRERPQRRELLDVAGRFGREPCPGAGHLPADGRVGVGHAGHLEHLVPHRVRQARRQGVRRRRVRSD